MRAKSASKTITRDQGWLGPSIPPGEILLEEYLRPLGLGQLEAANRLGISLNRLNEIVLGKRGITADTALRLARFLKTSPQLWMRLQADWDLHQAMQRQAGIVTVRSNGFVRCRSCSAMAGRAPRRIISR
jgi:addiction module HigA family antidote